MPDDRVPSEQDDVESSDIFERALNLAFGNATKSDKDDQEKSAPAKADDLVGRYRLVKEIGRGGFGQVFLAHDFELDRQVALKLPYRHLLADAEMIDAFLTEARNVARLDHPCIVPVYDFDHTLDGNCYIASKFIDGVSLAERARSAPLSIRQIVDVVALLADALQHAHQRGIVHRDVKPKNILIDSADKPYLTDFGIALRDDRLGQGPRLAGTPAYMSPEQARGEGHRVDGRSDVYSLGVVMYELLAGRVPFRAASHSELLQLISTMDARPPRQYNSSIPRQIDRICMRAIARRASERYNAAIDFAEEMRTVTIDSPTTAPLTVDPPDEATQTGNVASDTPTRHTPTPALSDGSWSQLGHPVVPRGLRSFDAVDSEFFIDLLPGPLTREGLPNSIQFWRERIGVRSGHPTFSVGLLYGPSGCGKSSLIRAGLLPRLGAHVRPILVDATPDDTEKDLLAGIRELDPEMDPELGLAEAFRHMRLASGRQPGESVLVVIDQFEQWLHGNASFAEKPLANALRHCDGNRLQCLLLVRDDFWMGVTRFVQELEINLVPNQNVAVADLFDVNHSRKVLTAFGRAYGALPKEGELTRQQHEFVKSAVDGLAEDERIICVRLALFAEMVKNKPWMPATLSDVGGAEGVGVKFIEETFSSRKANPQHRFHQKAARAVLKALLPDHGSDIRGHVRSYSDLLAASGYESSPNQFADLIRILDSDLRLLTPADPRDGDEEKDRRFQLTHDYLVPALRVWLNQKMRESRRGRAELLLEERANMWRSKPEPRHLPSLFEFGRIMCHTRQWSDAQCNLIHAAARHYGIRSLVAVAICGVVFLLAHASYERLRDRALVETLMTAETSDVPTLVDSLSKRSFWSKPYLTSLMAASADDSKQKLHAALALVRTDDSHVPFLIDRMLSCDATDAQVVRLALAEHQAEVIDQLWPVLESSDQRGTVLPAATALAQADPDDDNWDKVSGHVAEALVAASPNSLSVWIPALRPVAPSLIPHLLKINRRPREAVRGSAALALADYMADRPNELAELLIRDITNDHQYSPLIENLREHRDTTLDLLRSELAAPLIGPHDPVSEEMRSAQANRMANASAMLVDFDEGDLVWPFLKPTENNTVRSYLVQRFAQLGVEPAKLVDRLVAETDPAIRRALILALGEYPRFSLALNNQMRLEDYLKQRYRDDPDPGIHSAIDWFARQWDTESIVQLPDDSNLKPENAGGWYVSAHGQTMLLAPAAEYLMGHGPTRHPVSVRDFYISSTEVTNEQYLNVNFPDENWVIGVRKKEPGYPATGVNLYFAMWYCNKLSEAEGIPQDEWCYRPNEKGEYATGMRLTDNFADLTGYRLPTEEEWEYACRAGAVTRWHFGEVHELSRLYSWSVDHSMARPHPVAQLKPNDFGLFDVHGNVWEWCSPDLKQTNAEIIDGGRYPKRGGAFYNAPSANRFLQKSLVRPGYQNVDAGFRIARSAKK